MSLQVNRIPFSAFLNASSSQWEQKLTLPHFVCTLLESFLLPLSLSCVGIAQALLTGEKRRLKSMCEIPGNTH